MRDEISLISEMFPIRFHQSGEWLRQALAGRDIGPLTCKLFIKDETNGEIFFEVIDTLDLGGSQPGELTMRSEGVGLYTPFGLASAGRNVEQPVSLAFLYAERNNPGND